MRAGVDLDLGLAAQKRYLSCGPEGRVREADVMVVVKVLAVALEHVVREHFHHDDEVAGHAAEGGAVAFTPHAELHAVFHATRNLEVDHSFFTHHAHFVGAGGASGDALARALAHVAGRGRLHLAQDGVGHPAHLARSVTGAAIGVFHPLRLHLLENLDFLGHALGDFLERQFHLDAQVGALHATLAAATASTAEGTSEDVPELGKDVVHVHPPATESARSAAHAFMAKAVVLLALGVVAQHLVRFGRLLEAFLRGGVVGVLVRVVLQRKLAVRLLDL